MDVASLPINTLFVQSILRGHVDGDLYNDDTRRAFYAVHPYGMSLLWGEPNRTWIESRLLRVTPRPEWLQVYPNRWVPIVESVLGASFASGAALRCTRVNFTFSCAAFRPARGTVVPASAEMHWFGWKDVIDLGDITNARGLEMWLPLWVRLYGALGTPMFGIKVVR